MSTPFLARLPAKPYLCSEFSNHKNDLVMEEKKKEKKPTIIYHNYPLLALANSPEQGELMQSSRHPSKEELLIISYLSAKGNYPHSGWQDSLEVAEMTDGMGSLLLIPKGQKNQNRLFGKEISEVQFHDADGMLVSVSLNIDQNGFLFELDVWREREAPPREKGHAF